MKKVIPVVAFIFGAAAGSVVTWFSVKKYYEQIAQEEIDSVKEVFSKKSSNIIDVKPVEETRDEEKKDEGKETYLPTEEEKHDYSLILNKSNYREEDEEKKDFVQCEVIPPDEFGGQYHEDYDMVTLMWFADKYLAEENYELVEDVENTVGWESLDHFGEWEDDTVYVRNHRLQVDYEILLDSRNYLDVIKTKPHVHMEV